MNIGDWYVQNDTAQVVVVTAIGEGQVSYVCLTDIDATPSKENYIASSKLEANFTFASEYETVDDILAEYANYDYDRKFYRCGFVGCACRIKRALDKF